MANPAPETPVTSDSVPDVPRISGQHLVSVEGTASTLARKPWSVGTTPWRACEHERSRR